MASQEVKEILSPEVGVFPDEIAAIKKNDRISKHRKKIYLAVASVLLQVILALVVGTVLTLHPNRKSNVVKRSVKLALANGIMEWTVELGTERGTETFRIVNGTAWVMRDKATSLSAYKFDGNEKCYIFYNLEEDANMKVLLEDLKRMEKGEVDVAKRRADSFMTVDEGRGHVDPSELSDSMAEFCEGLQTHWGVMSSPEHAPTPPAAGEDQGDGPPTSTVAMPEEEAVTEVDWEILPTTVEATE